jgi:hypothetical protein
MGWDAALNRKLAVPLALAGRWDSKGVMMTRSRVLREPEDRDDLRVLMKMADNRVRLERLKFDLDEDPEIVDSDELRDELEYINASVELELLEITGELEEIGSSEEIAEEAFA